MTCRRGRPLARDPDAAHAVRAALRVLVGRGVDVELRVEQDEVGALARLDPAAVGEAEPVGGACGQARDGLLDRAAAPRGGEAAEEARRRAVEARMRVLAEDAVGADELQAGARAIVRDGLVGGVVEHHRRGELASRRSRSSTVSTGLAAASSASVRAADDDPLRAERAEHGSPSPGSPSLDVAGDPPALRRVARRGRASPPPRPPAPSAGSRLASSVEPAPYGYWSKVSRARRRRVDQLEQRLDQRLVGERLQVREVQRRARALAPPRSSRRPPRARRAPRCGRAGRAARRTRPPPPRPRRARRSRA